MLAHVLLLLLLLLRVWESHEASCRVQGQLVRKACCSWPACAQAGQAAWLQ